MAPSVREDSHRVPLLLNPDWEREEGGGGRREEEVVVGGAGEVLELILTSFHILPHNC